jgi:hypothetical protein
MKKILTATIVLLGLCLSGVIASAEAVVDDVTIEPSSPKALDTLTISATITSDDDIDEVIIKIKECDDNMCMPTETYQMELEGGKYTVTHEMSYQAATYFSYKLIITSGGNETETEFTNVTVAPAENGGNGGNGGNGNGGKDDIPGFELIPLFIATFIIIFYLRRKRSR